ncbi:conserved hypothetical protein [Nostocoides jenkinsii Ben 74]|uniref:Uncharacterized protein n=1 Tax=Nostocoides jenkinsii Ben 74 TaxID=1193518 RepID=A0A077MFQ5_9MICO|nr:conserved hypothetical protein [Tetrasphaera jenkinsii Ben 74]
MRSVPILERRGSSPRGRGGPRSKKGRSSVTGLIPARAGRTARSCTAHRAAGAHPRAGGADFVRRGAGDWWMGSSPRGRGGLGPVADQDFERGLIPARAGRTATPGLTGFPSRAHPRAGGADRLVDADLEKVRGLIPARAGRTAHWYSEAGVRRAHPRAGGADFAAQLAVEDAMGSSPRGRGGLEGRG